MNIDTIFRLLENSGFRVLGTDGVFIHLEDPTCVLRSFETFLNYAWFAITFITAILLFGWAISMIRGAKNDIFINLRNLTLIFGTLTAVKPIINMIWGGDVFARGCKTINVSIANVQKTLDAQKNKLAKYNADDLYEDFNIYDSGAQSEIPYSQAPVYSSGSPQQISINISGTQTSSDKETVYQDKNGKHYKKTGGTIAWRNNNPGNIRYSKFAVSQGAIGQAGGFAVFPDEDTGMTAIKALLNTKSYNNLTIEDAISRYAPPFENDTNAYQRRIEQLTGLSINMRINELNNQQMQNMVGAIKQIEGWKPGREIIIQ
ncbi:MAG: hypothetical protein JW974_01365 [Alphaproteobacteria bacterium]|nr:hypothetical protein [Alphaproteobacteria bacterium]MBN2675432.1 hypothetical protein [Alphaproteobacteria bacterium]